MFGVRNDPAAFVTVKELEDLTENFREKVRCGFGAKPAHVPVSKTLDDLKRLKEEILPKVDAR